MALFAFLASQSDIKEQKISNSLIKRILAASVLLNAVYFLKNGFLLLEPYLLFLGASASSALVLWLLDFWKPGDVKFYFAMSTFLHPLSTSQFLKPLEIFIILCVVVTLIEIPLKRDVGFEPKFSHGSLLPIALSPLMKATNLGGIAFMFVAFLFGRYLKGFKKILIAFAALAFILAPLEALRSSALIAAFTLVASIKFEGKIPSAPLMSASFIYLLLSW